MLLSNYYKLQKQSLCSVDSGVLIPDLNYKVKDIKGNERNIIYYDIEGKNPFTFAKPKAQISTTTPTLAEDNVMHIVFGTSNEMVSQEDYSIKGDAFAGITLIEKSTTPIENGVQYNFRFQNTGQRKEIGEICIFDNFARIDAISYALWREVFPQKIVVEPNAYFVYQIITKVGV